MRKILLLVFVFATSVTAFGQDFSNKGKDFWVGYGYHTSMLGAGGGTQDMVLYFATDQVTNITITIPANGYTQSLTTAPGNNVITSAVIPKTGVQDSKLLTGGLSNNGIHITSDKPMVAYAHIYNGNCSGATILYPTNTLGREYYSVNYKNWSNQNNANCWFYVMATDTGTTTIEITPQADQAGVVTTPSSGSWVAGTTYTVNLTQGQIYNVMGILTTSSNPFKGVDLTGSRVKSINNGTGCKKISVFSGTGRISITCNTASSSSDNYMVQAMPKNAWGKKYLTVQANGNQANNIYRVCVSHPAAVVKINGVVTALPLQNNFYYEIPATNQPLLIEADSAIMVAQYFTSQGACGNGNQPGDPEVIYLSAVEQNINKVLWNATNNFNITTHSFNVVIPNTGTALSSFRLDGNPVSGWVTHPQEPAYSYLRMAVGGGIPHSIQSDSGFNAIAYGFGNAESYGYNAGTNIRDLYQQIGVQTTYGIETTPSVCTNSPFRFKVSLPYIPDSMYWNFNGAAGMLPNNNTVFINNIGNVAEDSSTVVNGKTLHWYSIPTNYTFTAIGTYPITITTFVPNGECGAQQDIDFDLGVSDPPVADFTWTPGGCVAEPFQFTETTPQFPKATYKFWWNFGDPASGPNNDTSNLRNPVHTFSAPGTYTVRYGSITTPGCLSDTISHQVIVPDYPNASITGNNTVCINTGTVPVTFTGTSGTAEYIFSYNINGGATQTTPASTGGTFTINAPTNVAGTFTYNLIGVANALPAGTPCTRTITGQSITVTVLPDHAIALAAGNPNPTVCVNNAITPFTLTLSGGATNIAAPTGLPPGVTANVVGNTVTISGTPTTAVGSPFNYSITTTGNACLTATFTGTITVDPDHTISLTGGTASQTVCINTPITPITLTLGGGATGISPAGLPPGVTATVVGNIVTISGTPTSTAGSPYNYTLTTTGNTCVTANFTGALTVEPDHAIALAGGNPNQTVCVNVAIAPITLTLSGGATNIAAPVNLPPGVTANVVGNTVTISGTPTTAVGSPFNYTITTSGNSCLTADFTGTITVDPDHTISLTGGTASQTVCINTPIAPITLSLGGGATGITPAGLPPGVTATVVGNTVTISGSPTSTAGSPYNYSLTTTGNSCVTANFTGTLTVNPDHAISLSGGTANQTVCINTPIAPITLTLSGGATNIAAPVNLPPGVTANVAGNTVTISGTPTSAAGSPYNYSITTTGNSCLTADFNGTITVTEDATVALTSAAGTDNQTVCRNTPIVDIDYTVGGSATGANITWIPSFPAGIVFTPVGVNGYKISGTPTAVGTQTFVYTIHTTGPCIKPTATGSITVNALPVASFNPAPVRCANKDISFTNTSTANAASATYAWDFGDPPSGSSNTSTLQNPSHNYLIPNTTTGYTVTLTVTNSNGCISDPIASVVVMVNDTPRAGFIVPEVCINDVATIFTDTSSINAGANNTINAWYWDYGDLPSGPLNNSTAQHGSHLYPMPAIYQVTHAAINLITGCTDTIVQPITINSADPVSNFTVNNSCSADSVSLTNLSTVGFGNVTRLDIYWDNVGAPGVFETINTPVFNAVYKHKYPTSTTTQNYVVRMVAYSGNICFTQTTKPLTVYATPVVQFNNIPNTCYLVAPFLLTQGSEIGGVPGTGTYSGPGITNPNGTFNPQVAGVGTHAIKYTWTASNPGACIDTLTRTITVLDTAHAAFSVTLPSCEQLPTSFTNLSTAPAGVTLVNTVWDFGDASGPQTFPIAAPVSHVYANPGTYTVIMHNVSTAGCLSTDTTAQVTIDANHHIALNSGNSVQTVCVNVPIAPIVYTLSGGANNVTIPALPAGLAFAVAGNTVTISGAPSSAAGSPYNFTVQTTGNTCLVATANISITVDPDHIITRNNGDSAQSVCVNTPIDPITYDLGGGATGVTIVNLPPGVTYAVAGTTVTISGTPTTTAGGPLFNFAIQTTGNACIKANTIGQIQVNDYPVPAFAFDKASYCIPNATVGFINNTTPAPLSNNTYVWDFGDGSLLSTATSPSHLYTSTGPFTVTLKARSTVLLNHGVIGCESSKNDQLTTIHPQPKADFVFSKPSVCIGDNVLITDATDGKDGIVNQWHWQLGDGTTEVTNPITHTYADTITYVITMYTVNSFGCNSDTINVLPLVGAPYKPFTVYPYPRVSAGVDKNVLEGGSVQLDATAYAREPQYTWSPADYLTDSKILNPRVVNPKTDMTYRLTVTGKGGCQLSDDVFVKLLRFPVIPNTFSPNNDGINDTWRIDFLNTYPNNRVQIFTRAGKLVFQSRGYDSPWDGTLKGKPLPFDTYYYIIEPGNGRDPITGYVTILK